MYIIIFIDNGTSPDLISKVPMDAFFLDGWFICFFFSMGCNQLIGRMGYIANYIQFGTLV
jgi:hypothetical protein